jgi:hypothetical protein
MAELPTPIKTELRNFWAPCEAKFRDDAAMRNDLSRALAQSDAFARLVLALERALESRHCPRRLSIRKNRLGR